MPFLERPGARVHFEDWPPEGPVRRTVTVLNGHTRTAADLKMMSRALGERGFRLLALDNRGAGRTDTSRPFTLDDMAEDVIALWDHLGLATSDLVGLSLGGMIALTIVLSSQGAQRVRRLVLVSTAPTRESIRDAPAPQTPAEIEASLYEHFSPGFVEKQKFLLNAYVKEMARAFADPTRAAGAVAQRNAMQGYDVSGRLREIHLPTLVIHGERDRIFVPSIAEATAAAIPGAKLRLLPEAGHLLLAEAPRRLYEAIGSFLEEE